MKYVTVSNRMNKGATIHLSTCSFIQSDSEAHSASAARRGFEDGFDDDEPDDPSRKYFC